MKINYTRQLLHPSLRPLLAAAMWMPAVILTTTPLTAHQTREKSEKSEKTSEQAGPRKQERLISLVLLLREPRKLSEHTLANAVSKALGIQHSHDETAENFVIAKPPYYLIKLESGRFVVNNIEGPYFSDTDKLAGEIKDPKLRQAVHEHSAWLSIDWAEKQEPADVKRVYQEIGKITAALSGPDTLAIYSPETDQFNVYDDALAETLKGDDPLSSFVSPSTAPEVVSISDDDPRLKAAQAKAKKQWPEFLDAFREKTGKNFAVKGRIIEGENAEYMWLSVTDIDGERIHGTLANDPVDLKGLKRGQDLHIKTNEIDDWIYVDQDKQQKGGFTLKALDEASK